MERWERMLGDCGVAAAEILLPAPGADLSKWAVVACDQFTAEPDYWRRVAAYVGDAPSTYHIIYPEAWLDQGEDRVPSIHRAMQAYRSRGVLERAARGFVLVERGTSAGDRLGLVMAVDLERYDFSPGARSLIRPTEGTILARIPPRARVRESAPLETSHVMLLADDPDQRLIAPLYAERDRLRLMYDVDLQADGGRVRGWAAEDPAELARAAEALQTLADRADGLLFAVGDGNHSLATARQCWLNLRGALSPEQRETHPARFALVEVVNLHDAALRFEPIHRALFHVSPDALGEAWSAYAGAQGLGLAYEPPRPGEQGGVFVSARGSLPWRLTSPRAPLTVATVQDFLDAFAAEHPGAAVDYIHGEETLRALCQAPDTAGCLLPALDKFAVFPAVRAGGVLPRKTFSMGEARDKRYYMECRSLA